MNDEEIEQLLAEARLKTSIKELRASNMALKKLSPTRARLSAMEKAKSTWHLGEDLVFLPIAGHPNYFISSTGVLLTHNHYGDKVFRVPSVVPRGRYPKYCIGGKYMLVHHLVMNTFGEPKPTEHSVLRHLDDNPNNYNLSNLRWGTAKDNWRDALQNNKEAWASGKFHHLQKLDLISALEIMRLIDSGKPVRHIAKTYHVNETTVRNIKHGKTWTFVREMVYPKYIAGLEE